MVAEISEVKSKFSLGDLKLGVKIINANGELQSKVVEYSREEQVVRADAGYYALEQVTIPAVSGEFDVASIYNEDGTQDIYISDEGELNIEEPLQTKDVIPSIEVQEIVADEDYYALGKVVVDAVTSSIDDNIKPENIKQGVSILGVEGTMQEPPFEPKFMQLINGTITEILEKDLEGATAINAYTLYNQKNLVRLEMPDTIDTIGNYICQNCSVLSKLKLSKSLTSLSYCCFDGCTLLTEVEVPEGVTTFADYVFRNCRLKDIYLPTTLKTTSYTCQNIYDVIKVHIKDLAKYSQIKCSTNGTWVGMWHTANDLYLNGELIKDLVLPYGISTLGTSVFSFCRFDSANLGNISTIPIYAFFKSTLQTVDIGENLGLINTYAFNGCTKLTSMTIRRVCTVPNDVPTLANINAIPTTCTIYVPDETTKSLYERATNWSSYTIKVIGE